MLGEEEEDDDDDDDEVSRYNLQANRLKILQC